MASLCESVLFLFHEGPSPACSHPKLSIFERGAEQNFDLNNNFWLDFLTARDHVARTRVVYHNFYTSGHLGLEQLIDISNKLFEKVLSERTICAAEKPLSMGKEKVIRKNWQHREILLL